MNNLSLTDSNLFSKILYEKMVRLDSAAAELELYEFRYALENITPKNGWNTVRPTTEKAIQKKIHSIEFYSEINLKPMAGGQIVLDPAIVELTQMLFAGLVKGQYSREWVDKLFYFDVRAFIFFVRTQYYSPKIINRFSGKPFQKFFPRQESLQSRHEIGFKEFKEANSEIDQAFTSLLNSIISKKNTTLIFSLIGPSGAGKTEITERLRAELSSKQCSITTLELDNFLKDGEFRDGVSVCKEIVHFDMLKESLANLIRGQRVSIPQYDFLKKRSSHDVNGHLRSGEKMLTIDPAEIIFLEGNLPLHIPELSPLAGIKIVYLTDDPIRLKRKWQRDIDYRKKYNPVYFCNRYFRTQFPRAAEVYIPMLEVCDILVDTTRAELWITPDLQRLISNQGIPKSL